MIKTPRLLVSDVQGNIFDLPNFHMAGRSARDTVRIDPSDLIELPEGSQLFYLPERKAIGFNAKSGRKTVINDHFAVGEVQLSGVIEIQSTNNQHARALLHQFGTGINL